MRTLRVLVQEYGERGTLMYSVIWIAFILNRSRDDGGCQASRDQIVSAGENSAKSAPNQERSGGRRRFVHKFSNARYYEQA
jgi:hypothetical protein